MKNKASTGKSPLKNVLIPLDGGLDLYSNPKNLDIDKTTTLENINPLMGQLVTVNSATAGQQKIVAGKSTNRLGTIGDLIFSADAASRPNYTVLQTAAASIAQTKISTLGLQLVGRNETMYTPPTGTGTHYFYSVLSGANYITRYFTYDVVTGIPSAPIDIDSAVTTPKIQGDSNTAGILRGTTLNLYSGTFGAPAATIANVTAFDIFSGSVVYITSAGNLVYRATFTGADVTLSASGANAAPVSFTTAANGHRLIACNTTTAGSLRFTRCDAAGGTVSTTTFAFATGVTSSGNIVQMTVGVVNDVFSGPTLTNTTWYCAITVNPASTFTSVTGYTHRFPYIVTNTITTAAVGVNTPSLLNPNTICETGGVSILSSITNPPIIDIVPGTTTGTSTGPLFLVNTLTGFLDAGATITQTNTPVGVQVGIANSSTFCGFLRDQIWGPGLDPFHYVSRWTSATTATTAWRYTTPVPYLITEQKTSTELATFGTVTAPEFGAALVSFELPKNIDALPQPIQVGRSVYFSNSGLTSTTPGNAVEVGYLASPPNLAAIPVTTGGSMASGLYYYVTTIEWVDETGQIHISDRSTPFPVTITGTDNDNSVSLAIFNKKLTGKANAKTVLYRTTVNPGNAVASVPFFKVTTFINNASRLHNTAPVGGSYFQAFTDTLADAALGEPLYTNAEPGIQQPTAPPPFLSTAFWDSRLWGVSYLGGYNLNFSWPYQDTDINAFALQFNADNIIDIPSEAGQVLGIAPLDDQLILFGSNGDYAVSGKGPSNKTVGPSGYTLTGPYPSPGGMLTPNSWVRVPQGLIYQSAQGFVLLSRAGQYEFIGKPVRDLTLTTRYSRGTLVPDQNFVYFTDLNTANGLGTRALAFNYVENKWFTLFGVAETNGNPPVVTNPVYRPGFNYTTTAGTPAVYTLAGATLSASTPRQFVVETGWIQPGGIAGYGEITDMQVLGVWEGPHRLRIEEAYDYGGYAAPRDQFILTDTSDYQYRFPPVQTQVRAIRYRITITPWNSSTLFPMALGPTVRICGIMLNVGIDPELSRLANSRNA